MEPFERTFRTKNKWDSQSVRRKFEKKGVFYRATKRKVRKTNRTKSHIGANDQTLSRPPYELRTASIRTLNEANSLYRNALDSEVDDGFCSYSDDESDEFHQCSAFNQYPSVYLCDFIDIPEVEKKNADQKNEEENGHFPEAVPILQSIHGLKYDKNVDIFQFLKRTPKEHPGEHFKDQFVDRKDPRGEPTFIELKWNSEFKRMSQCDTIHMLYLLQIACQVHRKRVIERNEYFKSISRSDRYLSHVDTPQIITNFLEWHEKDKEKNVFTGKMLETEKKLFIINDLISDIGMSASIVILYFAYVLSVFSQ